MSTGPAAMKYASKGWRVRVEPNGCIRWLGTHFSATGYGRYRTTNVDTTAHRHVYETLVGPIPPGLELDHVAARGCAFRDCVNVEHLEPVTHAENVRRGSGETMRLHRAGVCRNGHPSATEACKHPDGRVIYCRACRRERRRG